MNYALAFMAYLSIPVYVATSFVAPTQEVQAEQVEEPEPPSYVEVIEPPKSVEDLIAQYFPEHSEQAIAIAKCESGLNPEAVGDKKIAFYQDGVKYGESYGLYQIRYLPGRITPDELKDAETNIKQARALFDASKQRFSDHWVNCSRKVGVK